MSTDSVANRERERGRERGGGRERERPGTSKLKKLASAGENNDSNLSLTQNGQLISLLHQTSTSLGESHLPASHILDLGHLNLSPTHLSQLSDSPKSLSI